MTLQKGTAWHVPSRQKSDQPPGSGYAKYENLLPYNGKPVKEECAFRQVKWFRNLL
ncbi:hypothetical protein HMPREF1981_00315 [Bacteroides pyogenes F0041]|uniref:Uncharacterized protein n=1 Tax=Bacteroides pyogenes F0041 TaxID=1321819 RepID=U2CXG0_9BACE|nr:hypothetical protein HMPREF1981_00315 [Bacteroides pyogenes F0041]